MVGMMEKGKMASRSKRKGGIYTYPALEREACESDGVDGSDIIDGVIVGESETHCSVIFHLPGVLVRHLWTVILGGRQRR